MVFSSTPLIFIGQLNNNNWLFWQTFNIDWIAIWLRARIQTSSAYPKLPQHLDPMWQPNLHLANSNSSRSMYIQNSIGDRIAPCLTTFDVVNGLLIFPFQLILRDWLMFRLARSLTVNEHIPHCIKSRKFVHIEHGQKPEMRQVIQAIWTNRVWDNNLLFHSE